MKVRVNIIEDCQHSDSILAADYFPIQPSKHMQNEKHQGTTHGTTQIIPSTHSKFPAARFVCCSLSVCPTR